MVWMKQLDAIRALGVLGVFYHHFVDHRLEPLTIFGYRFMGGCTSLDAFYVLSGFLITTILLKSKSCIDNANETVFEHLKTFMFRRTIRIFPIFYLTLVITYMLDIPHVRESIWWHVTYTSNYYLALCGNWNQSAINHLWSLAVEEQFYLVWPWLILLTPRKMLPIVLMFVISIAPAFRHFCEIAGMNEMVPFVATFGNLDLLALGGALAFGKRYCSIQNGRYKKYFDTGLTFCLLFGGIMFTVSIALITFEISNVLAVFTRTFEGMFICWFINKASDGFGGIPGYILELKPLLFLGKISYGLYLYHNFVPNLTSLLFNKLNLEVPASITGQFLTYTTITILIATVSWFVIEKPLLKTRNRVPAPRAETDLGNILTT